ncbi:MAG: hypothetical protein LBJ61_01535 [Deltaproteobacteria bacterium]|jgi:outer membrane lipoprotein-sorting protein|nr:hypothetical protein [Deltaproteobacteria bacterium]
MKSSKISITNDFLGSLAGKGVRWCRSEATLVILALLLAPLLWSGCALTGKTPPPAPPTDEAKNETLAEAMALATELARSAREVSSLAVRGSFDYSAGNSKHFFRFELIAQRPNSFHFTINDPLGRPAIRIISDGTRAIALEYGPAKASVGESQSLSLGAFMPTSFSSADFISLMAGTLIPDPAEAEIAAKDLERTTLRLSPAGHWAGTAWLLNVSQGELGPKLDGFTAHVGEEQPIVVSYGQFTAQTVEDLEKTVEFPNRLDLSWGRDQKALVRYEEIRLGFPPPAEIFLTTVPKGFTEVES